MSDPRLRSLADLITTKNTGGERPYVALEHVAPGEGRLLPDAELSLSARDDAVLVEPGDVLFGKLRPYLAKVLHVDEPLLASSELMAIRPRRDDLDARFLYWLLRSNSLVEWGVATSTGVKMPRTDWSKFSSFRLVEHPPISQQRKIADYLDRECALLDEVGAEQEHLLGLLDERRKAIISDAVGARVGGGPVVTREAQPVLPNAPRVPLKAVSTVQNGLTLGARYAEESAEFPYLRVANVQDGFIDTADIAVVGIPPAQAAKHTLRPGDVLLTEGNGNPNNLGRGAVWDGSVPGCLHQNHVFAVRPDAGRLDPDFLALALESAWGRAYFSSTAHQVGIATTNRTKVGNFPMALPPLAEQRRILDDVGRRLAAIGEMSAEVRANQRLLAERRQALIAAAVAGQLEVA